MTIGQREFLTAAAGEKAEIEASIQGIDRFVADHRIRRREVAAERDQAMLELATALLPALTPEAIAQATRLTGSQALVQDDPIARRERDRVELGQSIATIEADPRYRDRELLRAPRTGTLVRHLEELREFRGPLAELVEKAGHPRLKRLLDCGYGTSDYAVGWWRMSYYGDWKAADEICERFPGKKFADLRAEYLDAERSIVVYDQQIAELQKQIADGEALEREHDQYVDWLTHLDETSLADARGKLVKHLGGLELGDLADRLAGSPDLALLWKKANGLTAKLDYLDRIVDEQLLKPRAELADRAQKTQREIMKWSRPKYAYAKYPDDQFQRRFVERRGWSQRYLDRAGKTYNTVYVYDSWDRPSLVENLLWWDIMTRGRWDGGFIPEVVAYREAHPGYRYDPGFDDHAAAAATAAAIPDGSTALDVS